MSTRFSGLRKGLCWMYPRRLRNQLIMIAVFMVTIPTLTIGYVVETEGRAALLQEKEKKLSAITHLLDEALGDRFTHFATLLHAERIQALNQKLAPITERITRAFNGVGAAYYHLALDAIITYAPSAQFQSNVGVTINADHPGREVMSSNQPKVYSGKQMRGNIMNSMQPIIRDGDVIGYIWANELSEDISQQARRMDINIVSVLALGLLVSLCLIILLSCRFSTSIDVITHGLEDLA